MRLDPVSLRLFVAVAEEGTIAGAALREHIAAAAVSKRISELETLFETQLMFRNNKGVSLTAAGTALLSLARSVLHDFDDIYAHMSQYSGGIRGYVRVCANMSSITQFLPVPLKSFLTAHPLVVVRLGENTSAGICRAVAESAADIGIVSELTSGLDLEVFPFRTDELVLVVPDGHPLAEQSTISIADTLDYEFVGQNPGSSINRKLVSAANELGKSLKIRINVTSFDALCLMVDAGVGIGVLPRRASIAFSSRLRIRTIPLDDAWAKRELSICVRSCEGLSVAARLLVDFLKVPPENLDHDAALGTRDNGFSYVFKAIDGLNTKSEQVLE